MSPVRWIGEKVPYVGHVPPKRITEEPVACNHCGVAAPLENVRRWPSFGVWIGETRCHDNTQTVRDPRHHAPREAS